MRKKGNKGREGKQGKCPRCNYKQRIKTKLLLICCSNCGRKSLRRKWKL